MLIDCLCMNLLNYGRPDCLVELIGTLVQEACSCCDCLIVDLGYMPKYVNRLPMHESLKLCVFKNYVMRFSKHANGCKAKLWYVIWKMTPHLVIDPRTQHERTRSCLDLNVFFIGCC